MNDHTDGQLLQIYVGSQSEPAFAMLVQRHLDLVYSVAVRMVRDPHLAQDVTQGVFVALAENARQLAERPVLSGWLHRTAQNIAAQTIRTDVRRRAREQEAAVMKELLTAEPDATWEQISPHLDHALGALGEADRDALLLRYFERKSAPEMAGLLGISPEAAQKRVNRAVDRLRELFSKQKMTIGAGGLVVLISANAVQSAPVGLAATISATAILAGTAVSTSTVLTAIQTTTMTTLQKTLVALALATTAGAGIFEAHLAAQLRGQNEWLTQQVAQLQTDSESLSNRLANAGDSAAAKLTDDQLNELLKLRGEVSVLQRQTGELEQLREANRRLQAAQLDSHIQPQAIMAAEQQQQTNMMIKLDAAKQGALACIMFASDNQGQFPTNFIQASHYLKADASDSITTNFDVTYLGGNISNPSETIVVKEKQPWQALNGRWMQVYGFADGHAQVQAEPPDGFAAYEQQHSVPPNQ